MEYKKVNEYVKEIVNNNELIIKIGPINYIILKPLSTYCDVSMNIDYYKNINSLPTGIFDSAKYGTKIKILYLMKTHVISLMMTTKLCYTWNT